MNSILNTSHIYSCAVDSFLEVASCLFSPYLSNLTVRNEFTELLFNTGLSDNQQRSVWKHKRPYPVQNFTSRDILHSIT